MLSTLADEVRARGQRRAWDQGHELQAETLELLSIMRIEQLAANGVKMNRLPEPVHVARPGERQDVEPDTLVVSPGEFARLMRAA